MLAAGVYTQNNSRVNSKISVTASANCSRHNLAKLEARERPHVRGAQLPRTGASRRLGCAVDYGSDGWAVACASVAHSHPSNRAKLTP
jgi:hypothetical protein